MNVPFKYISPVSLASVRGDLCRIRKEHERDYYQCPDLQQTERLSVELRRISRALMELDCSLVRQCGSLEEAINFLQYHS